ncbi:MAG: hypothetical protein ACREH8_00930 [Opitutaceae bacterium]
MSIHQASKLGACEQAVDPFSNRVFAANRIRLDAVDRLGMKHDLPSGLLGKLLERFRCFASGNGEDFFRIFRGGCLWNGDDGTQQADDEPPDGSTSCGAWGSEGHRARRSTVTKMHSRDFSGEIFSDRCVFSKPSNEGRQILAFPFTARAKVFTTSATWFRPRKAFGNSDGRISVHFHHQRSIA